MGDGPLCRSLDHSDLGALSALRAACFTPPPLLDEDTWTPRTIVVGTQDVRASYSATLMKIPGRRNWNAELAWLCTHPDYRGRGYAVAVIRYLLSVLDHLAEEVGPIMVSARHRRSRPAAIAAAEAAGMWVAADGRGPSGWTLVCYWAGGPPEHVQDRRRVVLTSGVFDLLHRGHVARVRDAATLGDRLVVAVQTDEGVVASGKPRPVQSFTERAAAIEGLGVASEVVAYDDGATPELVERIRPDVFTHGSEWITDLDRTAVLLALEAMGAEVVLRPRTPGVSTTAIREAVLESGAG